MSFHNACMDWNNIRLELGVTRRFPRGSASRAFLLRLPLDDDGSISVAGVDRNPGQATVRRFWASEPDQAGRVSREDRGWVFCCGRPCEETAVFRLVSEDLRLGQNVTIEAPDGSVLHFRVTSVSPLAAPAP
jgi:hypothetical protein